MNVTLRLTLTGNAVVFEPGYAQPLKATSDPSAFHDIVGQALVLFETQAKLCAKNMPNGGIEGILSVARDIGFMATVLDGPDTPM